MTIIKKKINQIMLISMYIPKMSKYLDEYLHKYKID